MPTKAQEGKRRIGRPKIKEPSPIDAHVGSRVRQRRILLGMSQEKLGDAVELTFQQIQKYERGTNRIGASRLYQMSKVLEVPIAFFFEDMAVDPGTETYQPMSDVVRESSPAPENDFMSRRETLDLVRAYYQIPDANLRRKLLDITKTLANSIPSSDKIS
jgi:transcriptional regulator with XRE-family HTH domain